MTRNLWIRLTASLSIVALAIAGMTLGAYLRRRQVPPPPPVVTVSFLELTDGDCTIIETPDDRFILIDAGGTGSGNQVATALRHLGAQQVDLLVLATSADSGIGGTPALLQSGIPIRSVWLNSIASPGDEQERIVDDLQNRRVPIRVVHENEQIQMGQDPVKLTAVWPPRHGDRAFKDNLVCRIDYGAQSCLFLGALRSESEPYLISGAADQLRADVLQVTDHGAGDGSARELLIRVQPEIAVISSTTQTPPAPAALERLQAASADIWRTDMQGTITVTLSMNPNTPLVTGSRL
jgi:competence protein ComEC